MTRLLYARLLYALRVALAAALLLAAQAAVTEHAALALVAPTLARRVRRARRDVAADLGAWFLSHSLTEGQRNRPEVACAR